MRTLYRGVKTAMMRRAPVPVLQRLRRLQRTRSRIRYRIGRRLKPMNVNAEDIGLALREAGLSEGDGVFFQAAMSRFGQIDGGPQTVLRALDSVLGPDALVAMPAFPFQGGMIEHLRGDPVFDIRSTPSSMGAISERFRKLPGAHRSLHPTHSVSAVGSGAESLVAGHERAETPFGEGTPFARMVERGMYQVWFGTDVHAFTIYHTFECLLGDRFPIKVLLDEPIAARCIDAGGNELIVRTVVHDLVVARHRARSRARQEVRRELLDRGVMRAVPLGASEVLVVRLPELFETLEQLLERGLTIYDIEVPLARAI
jgi:aminoglycoside 3-N-acetyltransferase